MRNGPSEKGWGEETRKKTRLHKQLRFSFLSRPFNSGTPEDTAIILELVWL